MDFIDKESPANRQKMFDLLQASMRTEARITVLRISELGLVEMTRTRTRDSLGLFGVDVPVTSSPPFSVAYRSTSILNLDAPAGVVSS